MDTKTLEERSIFLFDVDGVIAETPHEGAWKAAAVECGIIPPDFDFTPFYAKYIAGEPGVMGARNILELLHEEGKQAYYEREKISDEKRKNEMAEQFRNPLKQGYVDQYIGNGKFRAFDDIVRIIFEVRSARIPIPIGAVSSSENAKRILQKIDPEEVAQKVGKIKEYLHIRNSLRDIEAIEEEMDIVYETKEDGLSREEAARLGVDYDTYSSFTMYSIFDVVALGTIMHWHNAPIEKRDHYCYARGMLVEARRQLLSITSDMGPYRLPYTIVFEDAPKSIAAISPIDFYCVGISRMSTSGVQLASKEDLLKAGAMLAYDENELRDLNYKQLISAISQKLPAK